MNTELALPRADAEPTAACPAPPTGATEFSRREKAAIVVRLLLAEGVRLPLSELPDALQAELTCQISRMRYIDRATLRAVVEEFAHELDQIGLAFPGGLEATLAILDGAISPEMIARLRQQSGAIWGDDPWDAIASFPVLRLKALIENESPEIGAVVLSKLDVGKAAELLSQLPGPVSRRLTIAVSETAAIQPEAVKRIGVSLAAELKAEPPRAFTAAAVARLGAILDVAPAPTREDVLAGLSEEDEALAEEVRSAIFTFADIPDRVDPRDVPRIMKAVEQDRVVKALAGSGEDSRLQIAVEFILSNLPGRLSDSLREEMAEAGAIEPDEAEAAQIEVVKEIRRLTDGGEIKLARRVH